MILRLRHLGNEVSALDFSKNEKSEFYFGRDESCDLRVVDRSIGRQHARFGFLNDKVSVKRESKFGKLTLNGKEIDEAVLSLGDVIKVQDYELSLEGGVSVAVGTDTFFAQSSKPEPEGSDKTPQAEPPVEDNLMAEAPELNSDSPPPEASVAPLESDQGGDTPQEAAVDLGQFQDFNVSGDGESEKTSALDVTKTLVRIFFPPDAAQKEEYELDGAEISIGRSSDCDVVLNDEKASRKHLVLKRVGAHYVANDLGSSNGTYINGDKITNFQLTGDDIIRIADTEFKIKILNKEYLESQDDFYRPDAQAIEALQGEPLTYDAGIGSQNTNPGIALDPLGLYDQAIPGANGLGENTAEKKPGRESLLAKFKRQPKARRLMIVAAIGLALLWFVEQDDAEKKKAAQKQSQAARSDPASASFMKLPLEKRQFVENTYNFAFDLYKNKEYERSIYEIDKVLQILPNGYKDSKEIRAFAQRSIDILKANEEERKRRETEERLRKEVSELVAQAEAAVAEDNTQLANEVFAKILERDPENPAISRLREILQKRIIDRQIAFEAKQKAEAYQKQIADAFAKAKGLFDAKKWLAARGEYVEIRRLYGSEKSVSDRVQKSLSDIQAALDNEINPLIREGDKAFESSDFAIARDQYAAILKIDPNHKYARSQLDKVTAQVSSIAKSLFIEALLAETMSDYATARVRYSECADIAKPVKGLSESKYYGMCTRKGKRYEFMDRGIASKKAAAAQNADGDPLPKEFMGK